MVRHDARITLEADTLTVFVPDQFYQDWLRTNFRRDLEEICLRSWAAKSRSRSR